MHGIYHDSTTDGLLTAARADYDNDVVRGAYADYLNEHDDIFGDFVRLAVAFPHPGFIAVPWIGSLSHHGNPTVYQDMSAGAQELLRLGRVYGGQWLGPGWRDAKYHRFERGLLVVSSRFPSWDVRDFRNNWAERLPVIAGVRISVTSVQRLGWIAPWLSGGFGLVEIEAPSVRALRPERFAAALAAVEDVSTTNLVRFVRSGGSDPEEYLDGEWWNRFTAELYGRPKCPVREACRIEGLIGWPGQVLEIPRAGPHPARRKTP